MRWDEMSNRQLAEYYEGLEKKNYDWYQQTGDSRYDTKQFRYGKIAEAFRALAESETERQVDIKKRMTNCQYVIERLVSGKLYTKEEIEKLLRDAVWW